MYADITIVGFLGADPEMIITEDGTSVTNIRVAVNVPGKEREGVINPQWYGVVTFGKQADAVNEYLNKGSKVMVSGHFRPEEYDASDDDAQYEELKTSLKIVAQTVVFLDSSDDDKEGGKTKKKEKAKKEKKPKN